MFKTALSVSKTESWPAFILSIRAGWLLMVPLISFSILALSCDTLFNPVKSPMSLAISLVNLKVNLPRTPKIAIAPGPAKNDPMPFNIPDPIFSPNPSGSEKLNPEVKAFIILNPRRAKGSNTSLPILAPAFVRLAKLSFTKADSVLFNSWFLCIA